METTKERAARCDRATHARRSSSLPAYGSRTASITRRRRRAKRKALRAATLAAAVLLLGGISVAIFTTPAGSKQETNILPPDTNAPAAETVEPTEPAVRYPLTDAERDVVERVVMAEAGGESFEGQMLVAQCILNAAEKRGVDPSEAVVLYSYTKSRPDPTQRVKDAVAAVFDRGETVVDEPILYFYNPALVTSDFHESQIFVIEEGGHRFFAERSTR
jgi:spore germination cell wall hydrolase CwlJ-like protein